ncbi:MAG: hypothetical protein ABI742_11515 [Gemmatimonadota bacterium]
MTDPQRRPPPPSAAAGRPLPLAQPGPPPFPLIAGHFAAGFGWAILGTAGLVWLAPVLASRSFLDPRALGLTHLFTLGWITTIIMGVFYQIFPAMLGVAARSLRVARLSFAAQVSGTATLACGLLLGSRFVQSAGWTLLFAALYGVAWNFLPQNRKAGRNRQLGIYISYAHMGLGFAMLIGGARIGDALGWWTTPRLPLLAAHFHFGAVGFASMTVAGLGSRMLPMFLGTIDAPAWPNRALPRILASGTVLFAAGEIAGIRWLALGGAAAMIAGALIFLWLSARWYRGRARRALDPATALTLTALGWLALALPMGCIALARGPLAGGIVIAYVALLLLGWLSAFILGVSYRVLPTLTWHHRFAARAGQPGTPALPQMVLPILGWVTVALHTTGLGLLTIGLVTSNQPLTRGGALLLLGSILSTTAHHLRLALVGRTRRGTA